MTNLVLLAEQILSQKISGRQNRIIRESDLSNALALASVFFLVAGLGLVVFASFLWLKNNYNTDMALALTGLFTLILAGIIAMVTLALLSYKQRTMTKMRDEIKNSFSEVIASIDDIIADPVKENPKIATLGAALLGFAIGGKTL